MVLDPNIWNRCLCTLCPILRPAHICIKSKSYYAYTTSKRTKGKNHVWVRGATPPSSFSWDNSHARSGSWFSDPCLNLLGSGAGHFVVFLVIYIKRRKRPQIGRQSHNSAIKDHEKSTKLLTATYTAEKMIIVAPSKESGAGQVWKKKDSRTIAKMSCHSMSERFASSNWESKADLSIKSHNPPPGGFTLKTHGQKHLVKKISILFLFGQLWGLHENSPEP